MSPHRSTPSGPPDPVPLPELSLSDLRAYRDTLRAEADRVSYWRRVTHGRIDVLTARSEADSPLSHEQLARALADTGSGQRRRGLLSIEAADPLPDLPILDDLWSAAMDADDERAVDDSLRSLRLAERQLNEYRDALHRRVDEATAELLERYRADPARALDLLDRSSR
ncbi:MAG: hypothetical protein JWQ67_1447 [Marmoricola sp.]|jgi:hypothetical protein|nr:hypothetical protein [Marmoricola sp.]MCW2827831.1 hypothetical protein [Marmoricola sp.]